MGICQCCNLGDGSRLILSNNKSLRSVAAPAAIDKGCRYNPDKLWGHALNHHIALADQDIRVSPHLDIA
jgi:hypothetical protein